MNDTVLIWDWNGTLLNDVTFCVDGINALLKKRSLEQISVQDYRDKFTFPVMKYYKEIGLIESEEFAAVGMEFILQYFKNVRECPLRADAVDVLKHFSQKNIKQYILSAMQQDQLVELVKHYGIDGYFEDVRGIDNHYADGKSGAAEELKNELNSDNIWFIGDTIHDYEISKIFGGKSVLLKDGHQSVERLHTCEGTIVMNDIQDLCRCDQLSI